MTRVLLLGGTAEARGLADLLAARPDITATASLAGVTEDPLPYAVSVRQGGFGGADWLARYLAAERITALIDATHPFATAMSANAAEAACASAVPLCYLQRPGWADPVPRFASLHGALAALPLGATAFLATGRGGLEATEARRDCRFILRAIEPIATPPTHVRTIAGRPPFTEASERDTLTATGATHLILKNSGGQSGRAKLAAAASLDLTVLMIDRPALPPDIPVVPTPQAALRWLDSLVTA